MTTADPTTTSDTVPVILVGRFPPPADSQTLATQRLEALLASVGPVVPVNLEPADPKKPYEGKNWFGRAFHFVGMRRRIARLLARHPESPVVWASLSPSMLGHWRDVSIVLPALGSRRRVVGVAYRPTYHSVFAHARTSASAMRLARRVDRFVFMTSAASDRCAEWIPTDKRCVIPDTVDEELTFDAATIAEKLSRPDGRALRILFMDHLVPETGAFEMLSSLPLLKKLGTEFHADFVGDWSNQHDRLRFQSFALDNDLENLITLHGPVTDRTEIRRLQLEADVFALPVQRPGETLPMTAIEAMSAASPVVTTREGSLAAIAREVEDGIHVPPRDPVALANAFCRLGKGDTWRSMARGSREVFECCYAPETLLYRWREALQRL